MSVDMVVIIPTRGRPENIITVFNAWRHTMAFDVAEMLLAIDADDPRYQDYVDLVWGLPGVDFCVFEKWHPMVRKLNVIAEHSATVYDYVGFAGDDHVPRTSMWAYRYLSSLREMGTGIVYGNDLHRGRDLPTQWAMTSNIIETLGRMVPAQVDHLFCDRSILDLGRAANCIRYLPRVAVEHMHYQAGKAEKDAGYRAVNNKKKHQQDRERYLRWHHEQLPQQAQLVRELMDGKDNGRDSSA